MDLHELRTGFKDWSPVMPIPLMYKLRAGFSIGERTYLDVETDRLIDSWSLDDWMEETEENFSSDIKEGVTDEVYQDAFDRGFEDGESQGRSDGKTEGYKEGYADARKYYESLRP